MKKRTNHTPEVEGLERQASSGVNPFARASLNLPAARLSREARTETLITPPNSGPVEAQTESRKENPKPKTNGRERANSDSRRNSLLAAVVLLLGVGVSYQLVDQIRIRDAAEKAAHQRHLNERIEFHKRTTGTRLNLERMETEMSNLKNTPLIPPGDLLNPAPRPDVMAGMPLRQEAPAISVRPDPSRPVYPGFADVHVRRTLEDEKQRIAMEQAAERQYIIEREATIRAFIENARRAGYQVQVDENLDVTVKRGPGSVQGPEGESNGVR